MCTDLAWEQAARQLPSTQPAQEKSNSTHGGSISMLGGLTMCELSVDDGEQRSEQNEVHRNRCDDWNDRAETWARNELTNGHKSWNNTSWYTTTWIQNKLTGGHNISNRNWQGTWVRNKLTSHSIESVGQAVGVRSDKRYRQSTFGVDTAASRTAVPARHPATRGNRCHWDAESGAQYSAAGRRQTRDD